jgi:hypothetical protein
VACTEMHRNTEPDRERVLTAYEYVNTSFVVSYVRSSALPARFTDHAAPSTGSATMATLPLASARGVHAGLAMTAICEARHQIQATVKRSS